MSDFSKVASALSRRTHDTNKDKSTDLDIAQASHALKVLKEIALDEPGLVTRVLKIRPRLKLEPDRKLGRRKRRAGRMERQKAWLALRFSTAYSRYGVKH